MALEAGSRLGPYEVVVLLDRGRWVRSTVRVTPAWEREVAIKVLPEESPIAGISFASSRRPAPPAP